MHKPNDWDKINECGDEKNKIKIPQIRTVLKTHILYRKTVA